ncbi:multicopper oxidase domain-containing protein [Desulfocurvibacter africanus]|uniref:multicopper oxidase domain-containing protein n=1 Tax=Desulfocurvibacter africanus TaxID=873 RepID=UPI000416D733|nr:multicopper oxidase domain-containing protein [Desulfocurvibacter africanus]
MKKLARRLSLLLASALLVALAAGQALAIDVTLYAGAYTKTMPDGRQVAMWGYGLAPGQYSSPGPVIEVPPDQTQLRIRLVNRLPEPTSIVIPGLRATGMTPIMADVYGDGKPRAISFERMAYPNKAYLYTFNNVRPGTYLYMSGTHSAVQVQMGLYGAAKKNAAAGQAYAGVAYDSELVLLFSEIDPEMHDAVANGTYGTSAVPSTIGYAPRYFLINGEPYTSDSQPPLIGYAGGKALLRLLNAGYDMQAPSLLGGYVSVVGMDANLLPHAQKCFTLELAPLKTLDALLDLPAEGGRLTLLDRRLHLVNNTMPGLGGFFTHLSVQ